jgi:serine protease Do
MTMANVSTRLLELNIVRTISVLVLAFGFVAMFESPTIAAKMQEPPPAEMPLQPTPEPAPPAETKTADTSIETISKRMGKTRVNSRFSPEFIQLFEPLAASVAPSTAQIFVNNRQVMLGTIVDQSGLILTKASELRSPLECRLMDGRKLAASVVGIDLRSDLALLKVETEQLTPALMTLLPAPTTGSWLATVVPESKPLGVGVVGVNEREISSARAYIGIMPETRTEGDGVRITRITAGSPADDADLLINDIIKKIDDQETLTQEKLREILANHKPGDRITLTVARADKTITIEIELANMESIDPNFDRSNQQNRMGSTLSKRRQNFPMAFQHDTGLNANQCGGPVVDSQGRVVGINIARSGRVASFALPMQIVLPAIERMRTGELSPTAIYGKRLADIQTELEPLRKQLVDLPKTVAEAESKLADENARKAETERMSAELQKRLEELNQSVSANEKAVRQAKDALKATERKIRKLEDEQRELGFGSKN